MADTTPTRGDYFTGRPAVRTRPPPTVLGTSAERQRAGPPGSPRTPLLGRSISAQFGTPGSFRAEQEDHVIYDLGARHVSAGFAGESRPRCILGFSPDTGRRVGDHRQHDPAYARTRRRVKKGAEWGAEHELYRSDIRALDLGLVEDKLERAVRTIHADYLQLDQKPRKAVLAVPSLLPTPLLEIALKVLFNHYTQPPSVTILATPILACVSAGLRNALVVEVGWEETVVTAVGEYKEVFQRRSVRAGKLLTREMASTLEQAVEASNRAADLHVGYELADEVTERMAWCKLRATSNNTEHATLEKYVPLGIQVPFDRLSDPAETALFAANATLAETDDHDLPIHHLAYRVLLALPIDFRTTCISRIVFTSGVGQLPGLKHRLLEELTHLVETRGWDPVYNYGSASTHHERVLRERSANVVATNHTMPDNLSLSPAKKPIQDTLPAGQRVHDDIKDPVTLKIERHATQTHRQDAVKNVVRGVNTLGAWAGASLVASLRVKGVHEVEREEFLKHGLKDSGAVY